MKHEFEEIMTMEAMVGTYKETIMGCVNCGFQVTILGDKKEFAQECAEQQHGTPTCESQYVKDVMTS